MNMTATVDAWLDDLEPSIERVRAELTRTAERDRVLRRLLRELLTTQDNREREREFDEAE
jgi:hypothetical protein